MDNGPDQDQFDDLFEPFELDEVPDDDLEVPEPAPPAPRQQPAAPVGMLNCPSCGSTNPPQNRHCEQCGARLGKSPLPVAPPPAVRTTPGGRALSVLAVVVGVVAVITIAFNLARGDGTAATTTTLGTTTTTTLAFTELIPTSVDANSSLRGYEPENLLNCQDDDAYWNDQSARGVNAVLTFRFAQPVQISDIELQNLVDDTKFKLNFRIKDFVITVDDLSTEFGGTLRDVNEPQSVAIASLNTTLVTLTVKSTWPAEAVGDNAPFSELALQCVRFFGANTG